MFGYISEMDDCIGDVIGALKHPKSGTIRSLFFRVTMVRRMQKMSATETFPCGDFKTQIFEGGVKVPAIVSGGVVPERARAANPWLYHVTDWLPTILNVAQQSTSGASPDGDGHNIFPSIVDDQVQKVRERN